MCFSATASFSTAIIVSVMGIMALRAAKSSSYYALAAVPLLFALQQAAEGMVWQTDGLVWWWVYLYIFFAFILWPVWVPCSIWLIEEHQKNKSHIISCCVLGAIVAIVYSINLIEYGATAEVSSHISYSFVQSIASNWYMALFYLYAVVGSCCFSSKRLVRFFGLAIFGAAIISYLVWYVWFASVWCFFAALLSSGVYGIVRSYNRGGA